MVLRADAVVPALGGVERLRGREQVAREFVVRDGRITAIEVVSDPQVVQAPEVVLED